MTALEPVTGHYVTLALDGLAHRVYFEEAGEGVPLLCQHTAGAHGAQWRHLLSSERVTSEDLAAVLDAILEEL